MPLFVENEISRIMRVEPNGYIWDINARGNDGQWYDSYRMLEAVLKDVKKGNYSLLSFKAYTDAINT